MDQPVGLWEWLDNWIQFDWARDPRAREHLTREKAGSAILLLRTLTRGVELALAATTGPSSFIAAEARRKAALRIATDKWNAFLPSMPEQLFQWTTPASAPRLSVARSIVWRSDEAFWLSETRRHLENAITIGERLSARPTAFHFFFFHRVIAEVGPASLILAARGIKPAGPISSFARIPIFLADLHVAGLRTFFGAWSQKEQAAALDEVERLVASA